RPSFRSPSRSCRGGVSLPRFPSSASFLGPRPSRPADCYVSLTRPESGSGDRESGRFPSPTMLPADILIMVLDMLTAEIHGLKSIPPPREERSTHRRPKPDASPSKSDRRATTSPDPTARRELVHKVKELKSTRLNLLVAVSKSYPDVRAHSNTLGHGILKLWTPPFSVPATTGPQTSHVDMLHSDSANERLMVIGYTTPFDSHNPIDHAFEFYPTPAVHVDGMQPAPWSARTWGNDHAFGSFFRRLGSCHPAPDVRDRILRRTVESHFARGGSVQPEDWPALVVWSSYCGYHGTLLHVLGMEPNVSGFHFWSSPPIGDPKIVLRCFRGRTALLSAVWTGELPAVEILLAFAAHHSGSDGFELLGAMLTTSSRVSFRLKGHFKYRRWQICMLLPLGAAILLGYEDIARILLRAALQAGHAPREESSKLAAAGDLFLSLDLPSLSDLLTGPDEDSEITSFLLERLHRLLRSLPLAAPLHDAIDGDCQVAAAVLLSHPFGHLFGPLRREPRSQDGGGKQMGVLPLHLAIQRRRLYLVGALLADPRSAAAREAFAEGFFERRGDGEFWGRMLEGAGGMGDTEVIMGLVRNWVGK
ncbi:hypothetical protein DFJ74DRAFT_741732, partial [Hyaloraphidium curvatum]